MQDYTFKVRKFLTFFSAGKVSEHVNLHLADKWNKTSVIRLTEEVLIRKNISRVENLKGFPWIFFVDILKVW